MHDKTQARLESHATMLAEMNVKLQSMEGISDRLTVLETTLVSLKESIDNLNKGVKLDYDRAESQHKKQCDVIQKNNESYVDKRIKELTFKDIRKEPTDYLKYGTFYFALIGAFLAFYVSSIRNFDETKQNTAQIDKLSVVLSEQVAKYNAEGSRFDIKLRNIQRVVNSNNTEIRKLTLTPEQIAERATHKAREKTLEATLNERMSKLEAKTK